MRIKINLKTDINKQKVLEHAQEVLFKSMLKLHELTKTYCPVDTGRLRNSINLTPMSPKHSTYTLTTGVDYGVFVEFGTIKMSAQPFFRPALSQVKDIWMPRYWNTVLKK